ncbi:TetR/AcrR family transcriptional regulator [Sphingosinicella soli]|uniref:AcrR family transcriptional regulator n=1 Tax=Sphingosinicella soli TaxID=333708 RepID=A0A7W7B4C8_9SPHN|nr:TetR/AcrR family transcriptional regulator [Sphingosinicella soli]MBB4632850.1 AcrR family transcriptional regulator [Sphingosinicella soli]
MTAKPKAPATRRFTREDWVASARKTLVERGVDDVKVDRLAKQMRVTRGSFYWHFQHRRDLLDTLLTDWEARNYYEIAQIRARWAKNAPDLTEVVASWLESDPAFPSFDVAVRAWARKSTDVAEAVERSDAAWIALLQELFEKSGFDADESLVRARITHFHQIGYYALGFREPTAERLRLVPLYYRVLTGHEAGANLLKKLDDLVREMPAPKRKGRKAAG